jgi:hypothetical protein
VLPVYLNQPVHGEVRACICLRHTGAEKYGHRERVKEILSHLESKGASVVRYEGYLKMTFVMDLRIMSYKYR